MAKAVAAVVAAVATLAERLARAVEDRGILGPYGDRALYGSLLMKDKGNGKPSEDNDLESPVKWEFTGYVPANVAELAALLKNKPDMLLEMVQDKLMTKYRAQSWAEIRGGNVTADVEVSFKGGPVTKSSRVALSVIDAMREAGMTVTVIPRVKKSK